MDSKTAAMIHGWLQNDYSEANIERLVRWMAVSLNIGGRKTCRALVNEALAVAAPRA